MDGAGGDLGPDLTSVAARFSRQDLLHAILEPSAAITDQYAASRITLDDGEMLSGRITQRTDDQIVLMTDPYGDAHRTIEVIDQTIEPDPTSPCRSVWSTG